LESWNNNTTKEAATWLESWNSHTTKEAATWLESWNPGTMIQPRKQQRV
jgi:hypothetical protein